jgi:hypothetical protein
MNWEEELRIRKTYGLHPIGAWLLFQPIDLDQGDTGVLFLPLTIAV